MNKELLAAVSASLALVDYSRRVKNYLDSDSFTLKRSEIFDEDEHALVKDLRNLLVHQVHTEVNWQTVYSPEGRSTHFKIDVEDLLADGELSPAGKRYLSIQKGTLDVNELLSRYAARVDHFYAWLLLELNSGLPPSVQDYRHCRATVKRHHARLSYRLLLGLLDTSRC